MELEGLRKQNEIFSNFPSNLSDNLSWQFSKDATFPSVVNILKCLNFSELDDEPGGWGGPNLWYWWNVYTAIVPDDGVQGVGGDLSDVNLFIPGDAGLQAESCDYLNIISTVWDAECYMCWSLQSEF